MAADVVSVCLVQLTVPKSVQEQETNNSKRVRYQHIWEDEQFSMGYVLPPNILP